MNPINEEEKEPLPEILDVNKVADHDLRFWMEHETLDYSKIDVDIEKLPFFEEYFDNISKLAENKLSDKARINSVLIKKRNESLNNNNVDNESDEEDEDYLEDDDFINLEARGVDLEEIVNKKQAGKKQQNNNTKEVPTR